MDKTPMQKADDGDNQNIDYRTPTDKIEFDFRSRVWEQRKVLLDAIKAPITNRTTPVYTRQDYDTFKNNGSKFDW